MRHARDPSPLSIAWLALAVALTLGAGGVACGGHPAQPCPAGAERCDCYGNGTCNAGLQCLSNLCVAGTATAGTTGASGATGAAGTTGASGATGAAGTTGSGGATGAAGTTGASGATGSGGTMGAGGSGAGGAMSPGGSGGTGGTDSGGRGGTAGTGSGGSAAGSSGLGGTSGNAGTGGNAGTSGIAGSSGRGGAAGSGNAGVGGTGSCGDLIDDMEAGTGFICQGDGRVGYWYTYVDTSASSITPPVTEVPSRPVAVSPPRGSSTRAMHASGAFTYYAGIGFLINAPVIDAPWSTFDASGRTGIEFLVKGTGYLRVLFHTPATVAAQFHGTCTTSVCMGAVTGNFFLSSNVWVAIIVPFASLTPGTAPFNPALLSAIEFQPNSPGAFDLWIDDVRFY